MTDIGFTGTQSGMTNFQLKKIEELLSVYDQFTLHHGDCMGADSQAARIAKKLGNKLHCHPPIVDQKRAYVNSDFIDDPKPYLDRNKDIVDQSEVLYATPNGYKEHLRSGTWSTIRYARKVEVPSDNCLARRNS